MRRALILISSIFISVACYAENVVIAPFSGVFGVNIASTLYQGGHDKWVGTKLSEMKDPKTQYTDDHMIASAGVFNTDDPEASYTVYVSCPNGMYFRSQTNPNYIRPFELLVLPRFDGSDGPFSGDARILSDSGDSIKITYNDAVDDTPVKSGLWCDILLVLPFDEPPVAGTSYITYKGIRYPLAQAEDYTALVTITITSNETGLSDSIVIPFSGYYDGFPESGKGDQTVSLLFTPTGNAANMNIVSDSGRDVSIGHIDFLLDSTDEIDREHGTINPHDPGYVKIFFSSSNSPYDTAADEFRFVHSSVGPSTVLTNYNSIGYTITVAGEEEVTDNPRGGFRIFEGTDHLDPDSFDVANAIVPKRTLEEGVVSINPRKREYFEYHGDVNVRIDPLEERTMLPGRYTSTVYMHVVTEGAPDKI